jgi:hypothetical protein
VAIIVCKYVSSNFKETTSNPPYPPFFKEWNKTPLKKGVERSGGGFAFASLFRVTTALVLKPKYFSVISEFSVASCFSQVEQSPTLAAIRDADHTLQNRPPPR